MSWGGIPQAIGSKVGIIANPASGKDIRRLVGHATTVDNQAKVGIIRRALVGLGAVGIERALIMPDTYRLGQQALRGLEHSGELLPSVTFLDMPATHRPEDSQRAGALLAAEGVGCIIVLGGDGTVRMASKGAGETPLLPISTGTNNVLPTFVEGTIAGLAAGAVAQGLVPRKQVALRHKWLEVQGDGVAPDRALVDVALLRGRFVGARAVWRVEDLRQIVVTRARPGSIGISAIAAAVRPIDASEPLGLALTVTVSEAPAQGRAHAERRVLVPLGPGLLREIGIGGQSLLEIGDTVDLQAEEDAILALDGEREITLHQGESVQVRLRADGPWIVDAPQVMEAMVAQRLFDR